MVLAWHVTIAPAWFDPIDTPAQITPYGALHALTMPWYGLSG